MPGGHQLASAFRRTLESGWQLASVFRRTLESGHQLASVFRQGAPQSPQVSRWTDQEHQKRQRSARRSCFGPKNGILFNPEVNSRPFSGVPWNPDAYCRPFLPPGVRFGATRVRFSAGYAARSSTRVRFWPVMPLSRAFQPLNRHRTPKEAPNAPGGAVLERKRHSMGSQRGYKRPRTPREPPRPASGRFDKSTPNSSQKLASVFAPKCQGEFTPVFRRFSGGFQKTFLT